MASLGLGADLCPLCLVLVFDLVEEDVEVDDVEEAASEVELRLLTGRQIAA